MFGTPQRKTLGLLVLSLSFTGALCVSHPALADEEPQEPATQQEPQTPPAQEEAPKPIVVDTYGLPDQFVTTVKHHYEPYGDSMIDVFKGLGEHAKAFDKQWELYQARKVVAEKAVAEAEPLIAAKEYDKAAAILKAAITPVPMSKYGLLPTQRQLLEPRDGDLPAILAYAKVLKESKDYKYLADVGSALFSRRKVSDDRQRERMAWVAWYCEQSVMTGNWEEDQPYMTKLTELAYKTANSYSKLGDKFYDSLQNVFGVNRTFYDLEGDAKKGEWVLIDVPKQKVTANSMLYHVKKEYTQRYNCKKTDRIEHIDPYSGTVKYEEECQHRTLTKTFKVEVDLDKPLPDWAMRPEYEEVKIIGLVVNDNPGPTWKITKAFAPDLRFIMSNDPTAQAQAHYLEQQEKEKAERKKEDVEF